MEKNTPKTDRRTRRTRQALYQGLIQLLEEKPVAEISVKELCQVCDLNRSTFYLHYASVQELLEAMEQEILEGLNEVLDKFDAAFMQSPDPVPRDAALAEAFQFLSDRSEFCQVILSRRSDPDFIDQVKAVVRSRCLNQWAQLLDRGQDARAEYFLSFVLSGSLGVVEQWTEDGMRQSPAQLAHLVNSFIFAGASYFLQGPNQQTQP